MKKSFAFVLGATLAFVASAADVVDVYAGKTPGTRVDLLEKDWKHDFALTFEASFAKDAAPSVPVQVYFPRQPGDTPDRWTSIHFSLDFVYGPRTFDGVDKEYCGTTWYVKEYFDYLPRPADTWRRLAVISHDGYTSFYLEHDGRLQRIHTCRYLAPFQVAGLKIGGEKGVSIRNVKLRDFDKKLLPKARAGFEVATTPKTVEVPVTGDVTRFEFIPGGYPVSVTVQCKDGTNACTAAFTSFNQSLDLYLYMAERGNKEALKLWESGTMRGKRHVPDTGLTFSCGETKIPIYTFPKLAGRYGYYRNCQMLTNQTAYGETGSKHVFRCEVRKLADGPRLYVDGDFCCKLPLKDVREVSLRLPEGACWRLGGLGQRSRSTVEGNLLSEPILFDKPFDTSVCRVNMGSYALECSGYLSRCPQEREQNSFLRRIPLGTYVRARVRCKLGGDTNRNTCVTARVTNFYSGNNAGRNNESIDQQTKEIPRGTKGEVEVVFDLNPGKIQDVIWQRGFKDLTFEVLGDCQRRHEYFDQGYLHPVGTSDVIVVGATLERSPVGMCVENGLYGNMFLPGEQPGFDVTAEALVAGEYAVEWTVADVYGKPCGKAKDSLKLKAGERAKFRRAFEQDKPGWYAVKATLKDAQGRALVTHDCSFVRLAPDTRKAGYESPWFAWTDVRTNPCKPQNLTNAMELCWRAGIRHAQPGHYDEKDLTKWGITLSPIPCVHFSTKATLAEREAEYEQVIRKWMTRFPHASAATIFHESGCKTRRGQKPDVEHDRDEVRKGTELCRVWRRLYPNVRLVVGNGGDSIDKLDQLFRAGFPKDLIDTMGEESVGGAIPSESTAAGHFMALRNLAREYGYDKVEPEACYEWTTRQRRNYDSPRQQAAMIARDGLIALAWGSKNITLEMGPEPDGSYFGSSWGGGSHSKNPECHPHPSAAAVATLTRVLDRCVYSRLVPTGCDSVYAVEYKNPDGQYVTALWTPKGTLRAKVAGASRKLLITNLYGASATASGLFSADAEVKVSEEPVYVTSDAPVKSVTLEGETRHYAFEQYAGMEKAKTLVAAPAAAWTIDTKPLQGSNTAAGKTYTVKDVTDGERGAVLGLTRGDDNKGKTIGGIRLKKPVAIPEDATTVGVWVKGNSSRGDIDFEIEDADGDIFHSTSRGWTRDWGEKMRLDFDGWRCVWMPLKNESPVKIYSAGMDITQLWRCSKYVKTRMRGPIKLKGVSFSWGDDIIYVNENRPVKNQSVRIGPCVAF